MSPSRHCYDGDVWQRHELQCICRCPAPSQAPQALPYLQETDRHSFDICLEAEILPAGADQPMPVTLSNFKHL